jgi:hypothetical protein
MTCHYSQNDIALYVEQDLPPAKIQEIELHLVTCDVCRDLAADLRESQATFKSLKQDVVSPAALSSVRSRVLAEVARVKVKPVWGRWVYAFTSGLLVVVMSVVWMGRPDQRENLVAVKRVDVQPPQLSEHHEESVTKPETTAARRDQRFDQQAGQRSVGAGSSRSRAQSAGLAESSEESLTAEPEVVPDPPKQLVVKLLTDDPNVVIYWLVDQKNGGTL